MSPLRQLAFALAAFFAFAAAPRAVAQTSIVVSETTYTFNGGNQVYLSMSVQSGGAVIVNSGSIDVWNQLFIGSSGKGTFTMNGGQVIPLTAFVNSDAALTINSGTFGTIGDANVVGGTIAMKGGLFRPGTLRINASGAGVGGLVTQTGGVVDLVNTVIIGGSGTLMVTSGTYDLAGGALFTPIVRFGSSFASGPSEMYVHGGTMATSSMVRDSTFWPAYLTLDGGAILGVSSNNAFVASDIQVRVRNGTTTFNPQGATLGIQAVIAHHAAANAIDGGIALNGSGVLDLAAANTYTGQTRVSSGTLRLSSSGALQNSTLNITGGSVEFYNQNSGTFGGLAGTRDFALVNNLGEALALDVGRNNESTTYSGVLTGPGMLVKSGSGALTLSGTSGYAGGTVVNSGTLILATGAARHDSIGLITGMLAVNNAVVLASATNAFGYADNRKVNTMLMTSGTLISTAAADHGWGVTYLLDGNNLLSSNGGVSSGTTLSKFAFGSGTAGVNTSMTVNSGSSTIAGRVDLRTDTAVVNEFNTNANFTVNSGATLLVSAAVTNSRLAAGFTKLGGGNMILTGSNSYSGTTRISGGTLTARNNYAMGTGQIVVDGGVFVVDNGFDVDNAIALSGGVYQRTLAGSLAHAVDVSSDFAGGIDTNARILAGNAASPVTLTTSFTAAPGGSPRSDVYHLDGTGPNIFVLELSFTSTEPNSFLGWLNGANQWVDAASGNTGNTATAAMRNFDGTWAEFLAEFQPTYGSSLGNYLGAYGTDVSGGTTTVWAVLNHNSAFAAIPEPGTMALVALGGLVLLLRRRSV